MINKDEVKQDLIETFEDVKFAVKKFERRSRAAGHRVGRQTDYQLRRPQHRWL